MKRYRVTMVAFVETDAPNVREAEKRAADTLLGADKPTWDAEVVDVESGAQEVEELK